MMNIVVDWCKNPTHKMENSKDFKNYGLRTKINLWLWTAGKNNKKEQSSFTDILLKHLSFTEEQENSFRGGKIAFNKVEIRINPFRHYVPWHFLKWLKMSVILIFVMWKKKLPIGHTDTVV